MQPQVVTSLQAEDDLEEIVLYFIKKQSVRLAERFLNAAHLTFHKLAAMPTLGQKYDHQGRYNEENILIWQVKGFSKYVIIYRVIENGIVVLRVIHGNRRWEELL
jgi:toxin ParE1/3/4